MKRIRFLSAFVAASFLLICLVLVYLQIVRFSEYQRLSQANRVRLLPQPASRGLILDRNGNLLAGNAPSYNLLLVPEEMRAESQISLLSEVIAIPEEQIKAQIKSKNIVPFTPLLLKEGISPEEAILLGQLKYDLPGVDVQIIPKRQYPLGDIACHLLGYIGKIDAWRLERFKNYGYKSRDLVGYGGVEETYDYILRPEEGGMQIEVDSRGRLFRILGLKSSRRGANIHLTIDIRVQRIIQEHLQGLTGSIVVLDADNAEVIALASSPTFDPNIFGGQPSASVQALLTDSGAPLFNRAVSASFPAGSVFKVVLAAAGLEHNKIDSKSAIFCPGYAQIAGRRFSCWTSHGQQDLVEALANSCNVFFYNLGLRLGPQLITRFAAKFGFSQRSGIDLSAESAGNLPYSLWERITRKRQWFPGDTANLSIGQGEVLVTPLQVARMMAAVANGGRLIQPTLLKSAIDPARDLELTPPPPKVVNLSLKEENLLLIRQGLAKAVSSPTGTAHPLADVGIPVAGKTGTAQVASAQSHAWFVGYFPVDRPRFVLCVFLEHGGKGHNSCLVARSIIKQMLTEGLL